MCHLIILITYMAIESIISSVKEVYKELEERLRLISAKTGMNCPINCSACCNKKEIEASPIEFYPLAASLYQSHKVDEFLERLDKCEEKSFCILYSPEASLRDEGACEIYEYRPLICRLFGYGYRMKKEMIPDLVTCKIMREIHPFEIDKAKRLGVKTPAEVPIFSDYFMQLYSIEPELAIKQFHVNQAIRIAIENLYFHFMEDRE